MNIDLVLTFCILLVTLILFLIPWLRLDVTALTMLLSLLLLGLVSPTEALAGFSQPVVLMIVGLFIIGGTLLKTGIAHGMGKQLHHWAGHSEVTLIILLMISAAFLSAFMSSTGTMAVFLPVTISLSQLLQISPSRLLMPTSFAALLGGMLTLIGTPANMIVSHHLKQSGFAEIGFFAFTPVGLGILAFAIIYMVFVGRFLLPSTQQSEDLYSLNSQELVESHDISEQIFQLKITSFSSLCNKEIKSLNIPGTYKVGILSISESPLPKPGAFCLITPTTKLKPEYLIVVEGSKANVQAFALDANLEFVNQQQDPLLLQAKKSYLNELVIRPRSKLIGKTLKEVNFREQYQATVLSLKRKGKNIQDIPNTNLMFADLLLVQGEESQMQILAQKTRDFVSLDTPLSLGVPSKLKAGFTLSVVLFMLFLMSSSSLPPLTSVLLAVVLLLLGKCITMEDAYRSIHWESVLLIACMMPMATALDKAGGIQLVSQTVMAYLGVYGPLSVMAGLFLLTSGFSLFISNTATTVLMAPIALSVAKSMELSPYPFLMIVAIAASSAFSTPIATPVSTMIVTPGKYTFKDFIKVGLPLQILVMFIAVLLISFFYPPQAA